MQSRSVCPDGVVVARGHLGPKTQGEPIVGIRNRHPDVCALVTCWVMAQPVFDACRRSGGLMRPFWSHIIASQVCTVTYWYDLQSMCMVLRHPPHQRSLFSVTSTQENIRIFFSGVFSPSTQILIIKNASFAMFSRRTVFNIEQREIS